MEHFDALDADTVGVLEPSALYARIADDIHSKGYSIRAIGLPPGLLALLQDDIAALPDTKFKTAGVGRAAKRTVAPTIRRDQICWITGKTPAGKVWLSWASDLQAYLNRRLFMGLFSFESHYAHYAPGAFYGKHSDAFKGQANRVLSVVLYLNKNWQPSDGGEMLLYGADGKTTIERVSPVYGTLAVFLSEDFPHEVLPTNRDRYSVAGWFRLNNFQPL